MTSDIDAIKTNEFLRLRKLRLQQVREQSKDIAKKIRQRAKIEKLRHEVEVDSKKEKEYFECQEKLVKRLESLYSKSLQNVGSGHKNALEITHQDKEDKIDLSKSRGREAVAELRKKKQSKLDEQKKILDRKLQAREVANEISREKSNTTKNLLTKSSKIIDQDKPVNDSESNQVQTIPVQDNIDRADAARNDMGTQWECADLPNEWEHVPALSLPKDDSVKDLVNDKSDKSKRINLFALSDEMPSSLRGGLTSVTEESAPFKPSLTLVSDYLQNRNLRLREPEPSSSKKSTEDLRSIRQTILRTRATKANVSGAKDKTAQSTDPEISLLRKKSISIYNHNTKDLHDVPCNDEGMVIRDDRTDNDAYTQAYKETTSIDNMEKEQLNKRQRDMRNRVAITRQNVDKEYQDTLAFLNSLPKETGARVIKTAYMDDDQQNLQKDRHQRKMQQEFKKIEKECYKHSCKHSTRKATVPNHRSKSKSPVNGNVRRDFEYSWMPVPESDGSLAIHTIPTKKSSNTVKFGQDSYHEYRSRHKHTPPTKDNEKKRVLETVILQNNSSNESSAASETSSVEDLSPEKIKEDSKLKDAERIIIYKILESKKDKKKHKKSEAKSKSISDEDIRLSKKDDDKNLKVQSFEKKSANVQTGVSFEELQEGVYKAVNQNGDNITSMYYTEDKRDGDIADRSRQKHKTNQTCCTNGSHITQPDRDFQKDGGDNKNGADTRRSCKCNHNVSKDSGLVQPSAATSTSSFKTAFNDKANRYVPESGFLKFIDEGGQETGKFYIGASGFIKDDDYEVVIQLRKKEGDRGKTISDSINKEIKETLSNDSKTTLSENTETKKVIEQEKKSNVSIKLSEESESPEEEKQESKEQKEIEKTQKETEKDPPRLNMVPSTCEKAVHTSFQDTYAIPDNVPKCDAVFRPATSTYTQTSFSSSLPRPVFMQMSSSTSTAYMSPPDLVLPKFLRQDHVLSYDDTYDSENSMNKQQYLKKQNRCKNEQCTCKRCACNDGEIFKIAFRKRNNIDTPPNTARSTHKCESTSEISNKQCKKPKCRKCVSRRNSSSKHSVCYKSHRNKSIHSLKRKSTKNLLHADQMSSTTQTPQRKLFDLNKNNKMTNAKLNPTVKKYINQLLSLNREGHKAIEIINQDCSNVTTPGSSIINVTCNAAKDSTLENKISLEDIKNILKQRILKDISNNTVTNKNQVENTESQTEKILKFPKKKSVHKVKSLNISKRLQKRNKLISNERIQMKTTDQEQSSSSSSRELPPDKAVKTRSKSSPTPRPVENSEYVNNTSSDVCDTIGPNNHKGFKHRQLNSQSSISRGPNFRFQQKNQFTLPLHRATTTSLSSDSGLTSFLLKNMNHSKIPTNTCTQTNESIDAETNFMKLAENKIQNMEKIADLTEKCTKRLSNLAKVLEEVRRNKSSVYSQISTSDSASESDNRNGKHKQDHITVSTSDPIILEENKTKRTSPISAITSTNLDDNEIGKTDSIQFPSFLKDIPKPDFFKSASNTSLSANSEKSDQDTQVTQTLAEQVTIKYRGRPPPALTRINLKNGQDALLTPHELSTVVEVDSPMSVKIKNQSSHDAQSELPHKLNAIADLPSDNITPEFRSMRENQINPDILQSNLNLSKRYKKISLTDSSDDSKMRMMDMKQFNDIMLKPFISLQEYAKQCNIGLDDGSNTEDFLKDDPRNDELSSLHSDGSLPDVIAELLKRNIIAEPFKFDSASNINSTTMSSESTISMLALSKVRKDKKKGLFVKNKENIVETSETLSISSNPDLEKAFQKLGMGWASSTLKKTKERLALSSSSSASSSSLSQFKIKSFSQNVPTLGTDSTSSLIDTSIKHDRKKSSPSKHPTENAKNAVQQTSLTNSMTVKEFLTNELAKKITFNNKTTRKEAEEQFVSLYETKMPEDMKNTPDEDESTVASPNNNRARTSTPVQIFKSTTYRSTSSSNTSNGLFSNADDLSSVKGTSNSVRNHSTSDKDDLTIPNCSLKTKKELSERSKSD